MTLESLFSDVRYALRDLRARPAFAAAIVTTLALGIGANAAMFGIVDRLLFRPPALLKDPGTAHRVYVHETYRGTDHAGEVSQYARYLDLARWTTSFSVAAGYTSRDLAIGEGVDAREMRVGVVSASFFRFFDATPVLGRYFTNDEDQPPAGEPVVVLGYGFWQSRYGGRSDVIGQTLRIGSVLYTIIGVGPQGFVGLWDDRPPVAYIPITSYGAAQGFSPRNRTWWETYSWGWMSMIVRRKPGVSIAAANADLKNAAIRSYEARMVEQTRSTPIDLARPSAEVGSILAARGPNASSVTKVATWVGGVSLIVLLIACANVANLLLARALRRRREIAVRLALGVTRGRLLSQLLTESMVLALLGGVAGLMIAHWGGAVLRATLLDSSAAGGGFRDGRTILFAAGATVAVGLLTGLAPVLQAGRASLTADLKAGTREGTYRGSGARVVLLVVQGALSVVLLIGAGLFLRSLQNVRAVRLGYDVDPIALVSLNMRGETLDSAQKVALRMRLLSAARSVPGVEHATLQVGVPFWSSWSNRLFVEGIDTVARLGQFNLNAVSPEFFATMGTRLLRGRNLSDADVAGAPRVTVVSEAMAKVLWPGRDPIGQCMRMGSDTMPCIQVVGIAEDIKSQSLGVDSTYYYYLSAAQFSPQTGGLFVRTRGAVGPFIEAIRKRLQSEMPGASYVTLTPFRDIVGGRMQSWELGATMFGVFSGLALLLAAVGLYSVIAYNVTQRMHELGVRVALGARAGHVIRLVVGDGLRVAGIGVAIGIGGALLAGRWVEPLLFQESGRDPVVFTLVALALVAIAALASWVPARRAARVDPNRALRTE
jgi:putative ABC transport system permease protein